MDDKLKKFNAWVKDAAWASSEWRAESWRDCEMLDGADAQWTQEDWDAAVAAGIDPITINRTFPTVQIILGSQAINRQDITAKARTTEDAEISQVMTEGMKFILDQSDGHAIISEAFRDASLSRPPTDQYQPTKRP